MKKRTLTKGMLMAALICGCVQWGGTAVHAAELQEFTLDPMIVTAQRMETRDLDTPASVSVITDAEIKDAGYKNVFDVIEHQLGMTSTGYGDAGQTLGWSKGRTVIRGFDRGTLVLVDGIPLNLKNYNETDSVPLDFVERIEIVKGAAGTLYGAEAMGGVVNIITKRIVPGQEEVILRGTVGNYYKDYNIAVNTKDIMISAGKEYSDSYDDCNDYPRGSNTDWWNGKGQRNKVGVIANISEEVRANFFYSDSEITRGGHKYGSKPVDYDYKYKNTRMTAGVSYEGKDNGIRATVGYNYLKHDDFDFVANGERDTNAVLDSYVADIQKKWDIGEDVLIAGYTFKRENYDNQVVESEVAHKRSNSIYVSYDKKFSDKFNMTFGLRGEKYSDYAVDEDVVLPQIQSLYKFDEDTSWYINIGKAFQMPTVDSYFDSLPYTGSLNPEEGWNYETGFKKIDGKKIYKVAVYHMDFENKFGWSGTKNDLGYDYVVNKGDFRNTGIEFEITNNVDENWRYKLGLGYGNPEVNDPTKNTGWVQDAGRIDASANLSYKNRDVSSDLTFKYLGDREDYSSKQVPARARLTWNTTYKFTANDSVTVTLNNLLDRKNYANRYGNLDLPFNWKVMYTRTF